MSSQSSLSWYSASDNASVNNDSNCNRSNNNNNLCSEQILLNRTGSDEIATENDKHQIDCGAEDNKHKANQTTSELRPKQISFYQKCGKIIRRAKNKSTFQFPWIIVLISTLQTAVYFAGCSDKFDALMFKPYQKYDLWRFFTYHFVHFETAHLFLNVFLQICLAIPLETEQGHFRVLFLYICGVFFGAVGSSIVNPTQALVGSSAGVYSLLFSHISHCILNWSALSHRMFRLVTVIMLFGSDVVFVAIYYFYWENTEPKISLAAHMSGGFAGFFCGLSIYGKIDIDSPFLCSNRLFIRNSLQV